MKKCINCGRELEDNVQFCTGCGKPCDATQQQPIPNAQMPNAPIEPKKKKKKLGIIIGVVAALVLIISIACCVYDSGPNVVKDAYLTQYSSSVTVGDALDDFLGDEKWKRFKGSDGKDFIECSGTCTCDGEDATAKIKFLLEGDEFTVYEVKIDGEDYPINAFMTRVYDSYSK